MSSLSVFLSVGPSIVCNPVLKSQSCYMGKFLEVLREVVQGVLWEVGVLWGVLPESAQAHELEVHVGP